MNYENWQKHMLVKAGNDLEKYVHKKRFFSTAEVTRMFGFSTSTLKNWNESGFMVKDYKTYYNRAQVAFMSLISFLRTMGFSSQMISKTKFFENIGDLLDPSMCFIIFNKDDKRKKEIKFIRTQNADLVWSDVMVNVIKMKDAFRNEERITR